MSDTFRTSNRLCISNEAIPRRCTKKMKLSAFCARFASEHNFQFVRHKFLWFAEFHSGIYNSISYRGCQGNSQVLQEREHVRRLVWLLWWVSWSGHAFWWSEKLINITKKHEFSSDLWCLWSWPALLQKEQKHAKVPKQVTCAFFFDRRRYLKVVLQAWHLLLGSRQLHHNYGLPDATWKGPSQLCTVQPQISPCTKKALFSRAFTLGCNELLQRKILHEMHLQQASKHDERGAERGLHL